jgi:putative endopeptidase
MNRFLFGLLLIACGRHLMAGDPPAIPRFSLDHLDRSVKPGDDFYKFACGTWLKNNPVPADKARWSGFDELEQRNWFLIRDILEKAAAGALEHPRARQVGDFFAAFMDTNRIEELKFAPIQPGLNRIAALKSKAELAALIRELQSDGMSVAFGSGVAPDAKNSAVYVLYMTQGGLGLPDRDYYLTDGFAKQREAYVAHIGRMFQLLGDSETNATNRARRVFEFETEMARASKTRTELRDPNANYTRLTLPQLRVLAPTFDWPQYFNTAGLGQLGELVVRQTNFFVALDGLARDRPLEDWTLYLRWSLLRDAAPFLHSVVEKESFGFYGTTLRGQPAPEPRWQRASRSIDGAIGEALGAIYVERHFPAVARQRMGQLIDDLRAVFRDRLSRIEWMSDATRARALAKFERFRPKIGHPETFRDYSSVEVRRDDLIGNIRRAVRFEIRRQLGRIGQPVDRGEWGMTPQTVNAYFNPLQNEIVFPAGILQPPFFDLEMQDAVNYGAIGVVIGHEITHGFDDQGRKYDADGNLNDWWTASDAQEFDSRAQKLVDQYGAYEPLPGRKVNGRLTLGENIADLGGLSIAYEALQRALTRDPSMRRTSNEFTPEQYFFLSLAQLWRVNYREAELQRRLTVDPHSPGMYRGFGPHVNMAEFFTAFGITAETPVYRAPELRAKIW